MGYVTSYLSWLQKDCPTGEVEKFPQLDDHGQTTLEGVYVTGDLTGIPLLTMAANSGAQTIRKFDYDKVFQNSTADFDVVIIGGGPSGVSAAMECEKRKINYILLESGKLFNTIKNFPKGKPIIATPPKDDYISDLSISDGDKESLINELESSTESKELNVKTDSKVDKISRKNDLLTVSTTNNSYQCKRVILAIGKSGNSRKLDVPGEDLDKVKNRLFDPADHKQENILVVGGGDSALETANALAKADNKVTLSYRKEAFSRPKQQNMEEVRKWQKEGKITIVNKSTVKEIHDKSVVLITEEAEKEIDNDTVYTMIGRELPTSFLRRSGILMEGEKSLSWYVFLTAMISFFTMLYFGKKGAGLEAENMSEAIQNFISLPLQKGELKGMKYSYNLIGWLGAITFIFSGLLSLIYMLKDKKKYFSSGWPLIKYSYLILAAVSFLIIYFIGVAKSGSTDSMGYYYSLLYCTTMALFGYRRVQTKKTKYIKYQVSCLVFIQVFFLFLLPNHLYQPLVSFLGEESWFIQNVLPEAWYSYGLILFWPLNIGTFGANTFWTIFPFIQSGIFLFLLIKYFGKGAYCGWICSCGGMAETLGDEYRHLTPHGPKAKKLENIGQFILLFAVIVTVMKVFNIQGSWLTSLLYEVSIDVFFAGVLGLGVYFFLGGRIWCRFGCPLAALMHIYNRFSKYRILAEKKKCISCNVCTKVCHMGIDVMNYANKGIPMNDVECVSCSACVESCPMDVLAFGQVPKSDPDNKSRLEVPKSGKDHWTTGLK
ncbi:MAG: NAD(P)-binding domain-containing protein [Lentisphaeraceae bacterium]|nr:NAD(P)-binding domain-containing protein [Lentisphaeraceae bacterium]